MATGDDHDRRAGMPPAEPPLDPGEAARWAGHLRAGTAAQRIIRLRRRLLALGVLRFVIIAAVVVGLLARTSRDSLDRLERAVERQRALAPASDDPEP